MKNVDKIRNYFNLAGKNSEENYENCIDGGSSFNSLHIGIEIEVKYRYFFPDIWEKYIQHVS